MNTENQEVLTKKGISFGLITLVTVIVVVGLWIANYYLVKDSSDERKKSFGDIFNPLNTLYSGLALSGIVLTILLQRKELSLQRQELKETRAELKRTATAQENSEKALNRQAENLKMSAKLSALNTLVTYYSEAELNLRKGINNRLDLSQVIDKKNTYVDRIEEILEAKENL